MKNNEARRNRWGMLVLALGAGAAMAMGNSGREGACGGGICLPPVSGARGVDPGFCPPTEASHSGVAPQPAPGSGDAS